MKSRAFNMLILYGRLRPNKVLPNTIKRTYLGIIGMLLLSGLSSITMAALTDFGSDQFRLYIQKVVTNYQEPHVINLASVISQVRNPKDTLSAFLDSTKTSQSGTPALFSRDELKYIKGTSVSRNQADVMLHHLFEKAMVRGVLLDVMTRLEQTPALTYVYNQIQQAYTAWATGAAAIGGVPPEPVPQLIPQAEVHFVSSTEDYSPPMENGFQQEPPTGGTLATAPPQFNVPFTSPDAPFMPTAGGYPPPTNFPPGPQQVPPQGMGYPPQQGPQQGGYPPQQGGYPPQQGGYPPQQGGYPPQQGGYPPQPLNTGYPPPPAYYPGHEQAGHPYPMTTTQQQYIPSTTTAVAGGYTAPPHSSAEKRRSSPPMHIQGGRMGVGVHLTGVITAATPPAVSPGLGGVMDTGLAKLQQKRRANREQAKINQQLAAQAQTQSSWTLQSLQSTMANGADGFLKSLNKNTNWELIATALLAINVPPQHIYAIYKSQTHVDRRKALTKILTTDSTIAPNLAIKLIELVANSRMHTAPFVISVSTFASSMSIPTQEIIAIARKSFPTKAEYSNWHLAAGDFLRNNSASFDIPFNEPQNFYEKFASFGIPFNASVTTLRQFIDSLVFMPGLDGSKVLGQVVLELAKATPDPESTNTSLMERIAQMSLDDEDDEDEPVHEMDLKAKVQDVLTLKGNDIQKVCLTINSNGVFNPLHSTSAGANGSSTQMVSSTTVGGGVTLPVCGPDFNDADTVYALGDGLLTHQKLLPFARKLSVPEHDIVRISGQYPSDMREQAFSLITYARDQSENLGEFTTKLRATLSSLQMRALEQKLWK